MDRDEALRLLGGGPEGIAEWNRRRREEEWISAPEEVSDSEIAEESEVGTANLSGANLLGADLRGANLDGDNLKNVNLRGANLSGADLNRANLVGADLDGADLGGANLMNAYLSDAHLSGANLYNADLSTSTLIGAVLVRADLGGVNLLGANLDGADLHEATCAGTNFAYVDLSEVKGLDSIHHEGPSEITVSTLIRSRGKIPKGFLLGCGLPDSWIEYLPSLIGSIQPIQFFSFFISHSTKDEEFARRLYSRAQDEGLRVWYAAEHMKGGRKILDQIVGAIHVQDKLLFVLSEASMQSGWVETELRTALRREQEKDRQILFPIRITALESVRDWKCFDVDSCKDLARAVREYHIPDFSNWKDHDAFEAAFGRLLSDLKAEVASPPSST